MASDHFDTAVLVSLSIAAADTSCLLPFVNATPCFNGTKIWNLSNKLVQMGGAILSHVPWAFVYAKRNDTFLSDNRGQLECMVSSIGL
jgi:hypothetical protein